MILGNQVTMCWLMVAGFFADTLEVKLEGNTANLYGYFNEFQSELWNFSKRH